ncbi:MAG: glycine--tRNA ligase subunit beta, partial [Myxococcales bacterium]|nr:glycine--tRNA ligase subunit beta [Myxococcales bacterium]
PVHWLVALHGTDTVPVEFAHTTAGRATRGHRFLSPQSFDLPSAGDYESRLEAAHVVVDPEVRKARMVDALHAACKELGGVLVPDDFLVHECATLVEEPHVVPGRFDPAFLKLPEGVVISVMRDHQRYFAVRDAGGKLLPAYLNVVNTAEAPQTISAGNDRVLQARLKDAQFFVEEDRKSSLHSRVVGLDRVVFQTKLGSIGDKVRRIRELVLALGDGEEAKLAAEAARLAKTDLISLIVGEFPELQGEMGAFYAREEGIHPDVATAIAEHYWPKGAGGAVPSQVVGALVAVADRADTLVGCFGIGLEPTGSADPFALRRAAVGIMRIANEGPRDFDLHSTLSAAYDHYEGVALKGKDEVLAALDAFFRARLRAHYAEGRPGDLVDACLAAWPGTSLRDLDARVRAVTAFREMPEYESLSVAFKRAFNIAKDAPAGDIDVALLTDEAEKALAERFQAVRGPVDGAVAEGRYEDALRLIAKDLRGPIDAFFEQVFVMVDDPKVRDNRLRLLGGIARMLTAIAHFNQLS